jgi:hypothetical protein
MFIEPSDTIAPGNFLKTEILEIHPVLLADSMEVRLLGNSDA